MFGYDTPNPLLRTSSLMSSVSVMDHFAHPYFRACLTLIYILWHIRIKARTVQSQQPVITSKIPVNNKRGMVFSARSVPMAAHAIMGYIMLLLSNNGTTIEERCFLRGPCRDVICRRFSCCEVLL
jgi:hypothetical protein